MSKPLFPLALSPMEQYMLLDDRPDQPMVFYFRLWFSGRLKREPFFEALRVVLVRHPFFCAVIESSPEGSDRWIAADNLEPAIDWTESEEPIDFARFAQLDLRKRPGYRIWVRQHADRCQLALQVHHTCCDGIGAIQFVEDLIMAYAAAVGGQPIESSLRALDADLLPQRNDFGLTLRRRLWRLPADLVGLARVVQFATRRGEPLATPRLETEDSGISKGGPVLRAFQSDEALLQGLFSEARSQGASLNDVLLRDLFLALRDWSEYSTDSDTAERRGSRARVMVPINLRRPADRQLPAANVVVMTFLDRKLRPELDRHRLLRAIRNRTRLIKRLQLGLTGAQFVKFLVERKILGGMLARDQCLATTVLSNVGEVFRGVDLPRSEGRLLVGDARLEEIEVYPPIRRKTWAAFGVLSYAGRLSVGMHCDAGRFGPAQGSRLLQTYVDRLAASRDARSVSVQPMNARE